MLGSASTQEVTQQGRPAPSAWSLSGRTCKLAADVTTLPIRKRANALDRPQSREVSDEIPAGIPARSAVSPLCRCFRAKSVRAEREGCAALEARGGVPDRSEVRPSDAHGRRLRDADLPQPHGTGAGYLPLPPV